ncbi:MAG: hypothetical protein J5911_03885 [Clostridia bacterium]|nr:hypothetical protein [Clostridia bacterium]
MTDNFVSELNKTADDLGINSRVRFYACGVVQVACEIAPYGKVAAIFTKNAFYDFGTSIVESLKRAGVKPISFILPENTSLNLSSVFDVICVPDDVRAVLIFERELKDIAAYIATLFRAPVIFTLDSINTDGALCTKVPFIWGGKVPQTDFFQVDCDYHVVVSDDVLQKGDKAEQYSEIYAKRVALIDELAKSAVLVGIESDYAIKVISDAIVDADASCDPETLLLSGLKIELANFATGGELVFNSAEYAFKRLVGFNRAFGTEGLTFALVKKLINLYALCASEKEMPFELPDHIKRAGELSRLAEISETSLLSGYLEQVKALKGKDMTVLKDDVGDRLAALLSGFNGVEQKYIALGGKTDLDFSPFVTALKYCGDIPNTLNFMSILRESGFTESF